MRPDGLNGSASWLRWLGLCALAFFAWAVLADDEPEWPPLPHDAWWA